MSQAPRRKRSPLLTCTAILILLFVACVCGSAVIVGAGGYLYSNNIITLNDILNIANLGPGEIQFVNLSDDTIEIELRSIDDEDGETHQVDSASMKPYDMTSFHSISKGRYELSITAPGGSITGDTCYLNLKGGDAYHVAVIPEGIIIALEGMKINGPEDINMATSSLCER